MNGKVRETLPLAITVRWASLFNDRLILSWEKNLIFEWWGCSALVNQGVVKEQAVLFHWYRTQVFSYGESLATLTTTSTSRLSETQKIQGH